MTLVRVLTKSAETASAVIRQLETCGKAWIAVAWVTKNPVYTAMMKHQGKLDTLVLGTQGFITDPDCLQELAHKNWAIVRRPGAYIFHPKLYLFEHETKYTAIVGSHNLTNGAFGGNTELSTATEFEKSHHAPQALLKFVEEVATGPREYLTDAFLSRYRASHALARANRKRLDELADSEPDPSDEERRKSAPIHVSWEEWIEKVDKQDVHGRKGRLRTLQSAKEMLAQKGGFRALAVGSRRCLAGLAHKAEGEVDWNYFGEMTHHERYGKAYARLVLKDDPVEVADALAELPSNGVVSRTHWDSYLKKLQGAAGAAGGIGVGAATRLACIWRPDTFVPVTGANIERLSEELGVSESTLKDVANYWDAVIETIHHTPWYTSDRPPSGMDRDTWEARGAMLDAIVYRKTMKK